MKVVINKCHGGFGLSRAAFLKLREMGNADALEEPDIGEYFSDGSGPRKAMAGLESFVSDIRRDDPQLVAVVEEMGEKASAPLAKLRVVEIPDGVDGYVDEYDGMETIAEAHRCWG